ncbi:MAG: hypothetical protein K2O12_07305, partial [Muribaculaceae bacterium]|nr:hypothetical protein [Muribaculaceae bacterium]
DIRWLMDGEIVCVGQQWTARWNELGEFYATIVASNRAGSVSEEIRIDVLKLTPPEISLQLPEDGLRLLPDTDYLIAPDFRHDQLPGFAVEWYINGALAGEGVSYMFSAHDPGTYRVKISARNED